MLQMKDLAYIYLRLIFNILEPFFWGGMGGDSGGYGSEKQVTWIWQGF